MNFVWFLVIGVVSGVIAGMGMGGGTLLIPMLTILMGVPQNIAQGVNLAVFIPVAIVVGLIYIKNKLIDFKSFLILAIPAVLVCVLGCFISFEIDKDILKLIFGIFILAVGLEEIVSFVVLKCKK